MGDFELNKILELSLWLIGGLTVLGILSGVSLMRYENRKKYEKNNSFDIEQIKKRVNGRAKKKTR